MTPLAILVRMRRSFLGARFNCWADVDRLLRSCGRRPIDVDGSQVSSSPPMQYQLIARTCAQVLECIPPQTYSSSPLSTAVLCAVVRPLHFLSLFRLRVGSRTPLTVASERPRQRRFRYIWLLSLSAPCGASPGLHVFVQTPDPTATSFDVTGQPRDSAPLEPGHHQAAANSLLTARLLLDTT